MRLHARVWKRGRGVGNPLDGLRRPPPFQLGYSNSSDAIWLGLRNMTPSGYGWTPLPTSRQAVLAWCISQLRLETLKLESWSEIASGIVMSDSPPPFSPPIALKSPSNPTGLAVVEESLEPHRPRSLKTPIVSPVKPWEVIGGTPQQQRDRLIVEREDLVSGFANERHARAEHVGVERRRAGAAGRSTSSALSSARAQRLPRSR